MCLCVRVPYQKTSIPHVFISFYLFIYTLYIHVHVCVFDRAAWTTGSTLDLKLARFLREACPFVRIWADFFSYYSCIHSRLPTAYGTWARDLMRLPATEKSEAELPRRKHTKACWRNNMTYIRWMEEILHQLVNRLSHYNPIICSGS